MHRSALIRTVNFVLNVTFSDYEVRIVELFLVMIENEIEIQCDFSHGSSEAIGSIEVRDAAELSYNEFFEKFMLRNVPVVINGVADGWECMNWIGTKNENYFSINFDYLIKRIDPELKVPIANCSKIYFNSHEKSELKFCDFLSYWKRCHQQRNEGEEPTELLYLKDWHLRKERPEYKFYQTPNYFTSDWLNEYCDAENGDDYRFVYLGPRGTWTPFHADVFSSYSWSTNIVGTKKWIFFAPKDEEQLKDNLGNLPFDISEEKIRRLIREKQIKYYEIIQKAGQTIFVPSSWHHQVWNVEDTISVNHNWFNGCNIEQIWMALFEKFNEVVEEISDCKDMENFDEHCQLMLKAVFGLNFEIFLNIISYIAVNRLSQTAVNDRNCGLNRKHAIFDLKSIQSIMVKIQSQCQLTVIMKTSQKILKVINESGVI